MRYNYLTENTCSQMISFDLDGNVVTNIKYMGGCDGNLQSIERILDGWTVEEIEPVSYTHLDVYKRQAYVP